MFGTIRLKLIKKYDHIFSMHKIATLLEDLNGVIKVWFTDEHSPILLDAVLNILETRGVLRYDEGLEVWYI